MIGHNKETNIKKHIQIKTTVLNGKTIEYELERKSVKNINLRIRQDGSIHVSANRWVSEKMIEDFMLSKSAFVLRALERCSEHGQREKKGFWDLERAKAVILPIVHDVYPMFEKYGVPFPEIKFRRMTRTWGVCRPQAKTVTFNTKLASVPNKAAVYVVMHELTHFLEANHSRSFYEKLEVFMPDWKEAKKLLKNY